MKKNKPLCDLNKDYIKKNLEEIISVTDKPKYICAKCARVANDESHLCKPIKMKNK